MAADYTYAPAPVLVETTGDFAIGATGVLREVAGGPAVAIYDLSTGNSITSILVGPKGAHQSFRADIASGILDFGSVLLPSASLELQEAAFVAVDTANSANTTAMAANATAISALAKAGDALNYAQGEPVAAVAAAPSVSPTGAWDFSQSPTVQGVPLRQEASDIEKGVVELATSAEVISGVDTLRAITPGGLSSRTATEGRTGLVELATVTEATTGTDTARAVTPAGLKAVADTKIGSDGTITRSIKITQSAYDALATKVSTTEYNIVG